MIHTHFIHVIHLSACFWHLYCLYCWYLFWVWDMIYEACRFEKSFEHSSKASKQQFHIAFNDFNVENQFRHMTLDVKTYAYFDGNVHFT